MLNNHFVNPYNFVPLEDKCDKQSSRKKGTLTGKIVCTLKTLTATFIPNDQDPTRFFQYPSEKNKEFRPVIPGSEIRGVIRTVYEAAFNGCLSQVNKGAFHRRSMDVKEAGLLYKEDGKWKLEECERVMLNTTFKSRSEKSTHGKYIEKSKVETGKMIYVKLSSQEYKHRSHMPHVVEDYRFEKKEGYVKGTISKGEPLGKRNKKHHESVFIEKKKITKWDISSFQVENLKKVIDLYHKNYANDKGRKHQDKPYENYIKKIEGATKKNKIPVYYTKMNDDEVAYLAPAVFSQEVFEHTLLAILDNHGKYTPCTCQEEICPTCHLFGFVQEKNSQASRIRFSDAEPNRKIYPLERICLPTLETPKPGAVEFYTKRVKSADYWTYDYKKKEGKKEKRKRLALDDIQIRGRKFYWHHRPVKSAWKTADFEIEPIGAHKEFNFEVYFECLTSEELDRLCNVLDINHSKAHAHKIGMAKPFGFGSIQIQVNRIKIRTLDRDTGKYILKEEKREDFSVNRIQEKRELLEILKFNPNLHGKSVSYPKVKEKGGKINESASHRWFTKDHCNKKYFKQTLPIITNEVKESKSNWLNT